MVEKTILSQDDKGIDEEVAGIRVIHRRASGKELFGFYKGIAGKPEWKNDWERFRFKEYLDREFSYLKVVGLVHDEGNRQITVEAKNEQGAGEMSSQWRRQARLILYVPKCGRIGVRGGLAGFKVQGVNAPVTVVGEGDRDYEASYEVSKLTGSLSADNITIHRLDGVKGDVSIVATAYDGNVSTVHDDRGITIEPGPIPLGRVSEHRRQLARPVRPHGPHRGRGLGPDRRRERFRPHDLAGRDGPGQARSSDRLAGRPDRGAPRQVGAGRAPAGPLHRMRHRPPRSRHEGGPGRLQLLLLVRRRCSPLMARLRHRLGPGTQAGSNSSITSPPPSTAGPASRAWTSSAAAGQSGCCRLAHEAGPGCGEPEGQLGC